MSKTLFKPLDEPVTKENDVEIFRKQASGTLVSMGWIRSLKTLPSQDEIEDIIKDNERTRSEMITEYCVLKNPETGELLTDEETQSVLSSVHATAALSDDLWDFVNSQTPEKNSKKSRGRGRKR